MIVGLVPNSLILAIVLAYALGAVRMAGKGALIQEANAVESLSNVDVLCTDKTGTLTTNVIRVHELEPLEASRAELESLLATYAASTAVPNRTIEALVAGLARPAAAGRPPRRPSRRSASGAASLSPTAACPSGTLVLGAPEVLTPRLRADPGIAERTAAVERRRPACAAAGRHAGANHASPRPAARRCCRPASCRWAWSAWPTSCVPRWPRRCASSAPPASRSR